MVFMCNMRFGDYLQTDESAYNKMAIAADTARRGLGATKGGKKTSVLTGEYMKVRVEDMRPIYRRARDETRQHARASHRARRVGLSLRRSSYRTRPASLTSGG